MKKQNGFIAVSLIYSFFLVFLMIMLSTSIKNAQTRLLLLTIKNEIKKDLNNQEEFIVTKIPSKNPQTNQDYKIGEEINFVGDKWLVVENKTASVVLVLKRALNQEEITESLEIENTNRDYFASSCNNTSCKIRMCLTAYYDNTCYFQSASNYLYYNWEASVVKQVLDAWFQNNLNLQKVCRLQYDGTTKKRVCSKNTMVSMNFSDGIKSYTGYIRIPTEAEASRGRNSWVKNDGGYRAIDAWTLTKQNLSDGKSYLYDTLGNIRQNENVMTIRPVIEIRKS